MSNLPPAWFLFFALWMTSTQCFAQLREVPYWIFRGHLGHSLQDRTESVIRTQAEFRRLWKATHRLSERAPPEPRVDFGAETLIAVGLGQRSSGGYAIDINRISERGKTLVVDYSTYSAGMNCMVTQSHTSPVILVRLPKSNNLVVFNANDHVKDCPK